MKICKKCNSEFASSFVDNDGVRHILNRRKYCLECSPFGEHNTKQIEKIEISDTKQCNICKETKPKEDFYSKTKNGRLFTYCKQCTSKVTSYRQKQNKKDCINYKGGKCQICGYNKIDEALQFFFI